MKVLILISGWCIMTSLTFTATYYGSIFHGRKTASGEVFDKNKLTCASNHFRMGSKLQITNLNNRKSVIVKVNDKGGFKGAVIDLSEGAFKKIADLKQGRIKIKVHQILKK